MWTKLEKRSDWGTIYYAPLGKGLKNGRYADYSLALKFGKIIKVRFPNGFSKEYDVVQKTHYETVSDHGHTDTVKNTIYGIEVDVYGLKVWVDLVDLEVDI